ncbi:hypothetical protein LTR08_002171 [Meristemomyces frigidus]|nr:hypothetical protein LTR08_002171 [Meristemomyces frigidus]
MAQTLAQAKALIERLAGYRFRNENILLEAIDTTGLRVAQSNQRLALLGDATVKQVLLDEWYPSGSSKGTGNTIISTVGSNDNLATVARNCGLHTCVITHPGHRGAVSQGTLATMVEAIIGAVYVDSDKNMTAVRAVMSALEITALPSV